MNGRIPATLISGYLGAGKTTLVNHLLRHAQGRRIAVLVNDFGDINIDADLIAADEGGPDGDLINLAGGCVCCSFGSDLMGAIEQLSQRAQPPQHLLIEASGVALPAPVAGSLRLFDCIALQAIVVLADAETIVARLSDRYVGDTVRGQLAAADLIVLNKTDLVGSGARAAAESALRAVAPRARLVATRRSALPASVLLGWSDDAEDAEDAEDAKGERPRDGGRRRARSEAPDAPAGSPAYATLFAPRALRPAHDRFATFSLRFDAPIDAEQFAASLADPRLGLYRAKVLAQRPDGAPVAIQLVGARFEVTASSHGMPHQGRLMCVGARDRLDDVELHDEIRRRLDQASRAPRGA